MVYIDQVTAEYIFSSIIFFFSIFSSIHTKAGGHIGCCDCQNTVSKNAKFRGQARMFLTSGYILVVCVLVKLDFLHTFKREFSHKVGCSEA